MNQYSTILAVVIVLLCGGSFPSQVGAALLPGVNTLADLLNRGEVTVGDVRYYDFIYLATARSAPSAQQVAVDVPAGGALGLTLSADWTVTGGATHALLLQFKVSPGPSINRLGAVTTTLTGRSATAVAVANVTDTVSILPSDVTPVINRVAADTAGGTFSVTLPLSVSATEFSISKILSLRSSAADSAASSISSVSTIFTPVHLPEPSAVIGLGLIGMMVGMRRRRG